tara:strand:+ start:6637 stop:7443 length:807 start_codon:yes stop_codon:yes gene_type:complete
MTIDTDDLQIGLEGFDERLRFPHRGVSLVKGGAGTGKSTFAYLAIASLQKWLPEPLPVFYIDTEGGFSHARLHDIIKGYGCPAEPDLTLIEVTNWKELKEQVGVMREYEKPRIAVLDSIGFMFRQEFWENGVNSRTGKPTYREAGEVVRDLSRILMDMRHTVRQSNGYGIITNWLRSPFTDAATTKKKSTEERSRWDFLCGDTLAYLSKSIYDLQYYPWRCGTLTVDKHKNAPMGMTVHYRFNDEGIEYVTPSTFAAARATWEKEQKR